MYNHIYSIVEDFVKAVEQEKKYSIFLEHWNGNAVLKEGCQLPKSFH